MTRLNMNRIVNHAVAYALLGGTLGCGGRSLESGSEAGTGNNPRTGNGTAGQNSAGNTVTGLAGTSGAGGSPGASDPVDPGAGATTSQAGSGNVIGPPDAGTVVPAGAVLACPPEGTSLFELMNLAATPDYISRRIARSSDAMHVTPTAEADTFGRACSNASDAAQCLADLDAAWPTVESEWVECVQLCSYSALITNTGDEVQVLQTLAGIQGLLGDIDTPSEALLWAVANGYSPLCDSSTVAHNDPGYLLSTQEMISDCPVQYGDVILQVHPDGEIEELSRVKLPETGACVGRRGEGLQCLQRSHSGQQLGDFFAEIAQLEEAAVDAFAVMAKELARFAAPPELVADALQARREEQRHTQLMAELARRHGAKPMHPQIAVTPRRGLFDFALENAVEGCVRESFGAAYASYQAHCARDAEVRAALHEIARDESGHAALSWRIHEWLLPQLDAAQCEQLALAQREAIATLRQQVHSEQPEAVRHHAGAPGIRACLALLDALQAELWTQHVNQA